MKDSALGHGVTVRLRSDPALLCLTRAVVRGCGLLAGFDDSVVHRLTLAVDEACTNVIRHCYAGRTDQLLDLTCRFEPGERRLRIELRDEGPRVDPASLRPKPCADEPTPGGLGLHLIHDIMDTVELRPCAEGGNVLLLELSRVEAGPSDVEDEGAGADDEGAVDANPPMDPDPGGV